MSPSQHTPGPWTACNSGKCACGHINSKDHPVATVIGGDFGDQWPDIRKNSVTGEPEAFMNTGVYGHVPADISTANAMLIAASPALYAALKQSKQFIVDTLHFNENSQPIHECEFGTNPEAGHCSFCSMWADINLALDAVEGKEVPA